MFSLRLEIFLLVKCCATKISLYFQRDVDEPINPHFSVSLFHQKHVVVREKYINNSKNLACNTL